LSKAELPEMMHVLMPESIIERISYRKEASGSHPRDFLRIKGAKI